MVKPSFLRLLAVAFAVAVVLAPSAAAHAVLQRSIPADRAALRTAPAAVRFFYDDPVQPAPGIAAIRNGGGSVLGGKPHTSGKELIVPLKSGLGNGVYSVRWQVVSADGHETAGVIAFAVGSGNPVAALSAGAGGPGALVVLTRWLWFLGLLAAAGIAVFHVVIWRTALPDAGATEDEALGDGERREGSLLLSVCFTLALTGALGLIALSHDAGSTRFGQVVIAAAALSGAGLAASLLSLATRFTRPAALFAAVAMLPLPTLAGHALDPGHSRIDVVVDVTHVTAAGVWLGGLLSLLVIAPRAAASLLPERRAALLGPVAVRFSSLALAAVALLVGSGIWRAVVELSAISQLWTTGYGRAILVKSTLLLLTIGLAARNRYLFLAGPFRRLRLGVLGESVLLLGVILAVAFLTDLPPGRLAAEARAASPQAAVPEARPPKLPPPGALVQAKEDGRLDVGLAAQQRPSRRLALTVTVVTPEEKGKSGLAVSLNGARADSCGSGCYRAVVPRKGVAHVVVSGNALEFRIPRRWPSAEAILRRATREFRHLHSVAYVERLSSGPGVRLLSHFRLEAPDKLSYSIRGGSDGVVIAARRWDRSAGGRWIESATSPLPQPTPIWGLHPRGARLLSRTKRVAEVSFLDRSLPAWFTIRLDRRTLHPLSLRMTAPAHFMRHRYTGFNDVPPIRPPTGRGASR